MTKRTLSHTIGIVTLAGIIESKINRDSDLCRFTLRVGPDQLFFIQARDRRVELCAQIDRGDAVILSAFPRSFVYHGCGKHHVFFDLVVISVV